MRGWLSKHPLPGMYHNSRLSEQKQVFSINHIVRTNIFRHNEPLLSVRVVGTFEKLNFSDASSGPILQAGLSKDSSLGPAMLTFFLDTIPDLFSG